MDRGKFRLYDGDRVINLRPVFLVAFAAGAAAFCAFLFGWYALIGAGPIVIAFAVLSAVMRRKQKSVRLTLILGTVLVVVFGGVVVRFCIEQDSFESALATEGKYSVQGTAEEISVTDNGYRIVLKNVRLFSEREFFSLDYKLVVYTFGEGNFSAGQVLRFSAEVEKIDFSSYGRVNASYVIDGIAYRASCSASGVECVEKRFDLFGAVRDRIRTILFSSMEEDSAGIAYAMLTGDSDVIDDGMLSVFRYGGIAHIFAVSGLHIGIVYSVLRFIFRKIRAKGYVRLPLTAAVLIFYAGVCGFSPSSVRALVMCLVLSLAETGGVKYDALNSVSLAALCILFLNPVYFYSVGFRLSVCAAGGIILLGGPFTRFLGRIRFIPRKAASALSVCFAAQLATFPVLIDSFGYVSALSLVLNLVFVPIISVVYAALFLCTAAACVFPYAASVLLFLPEAALSLALIPVFAVGWYLYLICGFSFGGTAALWYAFLFFLSDKINLRRLFRVIVLLFLAALLAVSMFLRNFGFAETSIDVYSCYGTNLVFVEKGSFSALILTGKTDSAYAERFFMKEGIDHVDAIILACAAQEADAALISVCALTEVKFAYISAQAEFCDTFRTVNVYEKEEAFSLGGVEFSFAGSTGVVLETDGVRVLVAGENFQPCYVGKTDLLIANTFDPAVSDAVMPADSLYFEKAEGKLSVYRTGQLQIGIKNGIISCRRTEGIA